MDKVTFEWDPVVRGLGVRVNKSGSTVFVVKYVLEGKQVWKTIGPTELITLDQARRLAHRMKLVAKGGDDPADLISSFISSNGITRNGSITFGRFCEIYLERHAREHKEKSWKKDKGRIAKHLTAWQGKRLAEISRADVSKLHSEIGCTRPVAANRLKEQLHTMFKLAVIWGYLPEGHPNPAWGIRSYKEVSRDRFVEHSEMGRLAKALNAYPDLYQRSAIKLDLYTGMRTAEILSLQWDQVDLEGGFLKLPPGNTKTDAPLRQPLSAPALELLRSLPRKEGNPFVFPGRFRGTHLARVDKAWRKIRKDADLEDVNLHDLRRTVGSWIVQTTGSLRLVGRVLNQTNQHVTAIYAHYHDKDVRDALENHGTAMKTFLDEDATHPPKTGSL